MKFSLKSLSALVLSVAALSTASVSFADTVVLFAGPAYSGSNSNPYQYGQGGEFTAVTSNGIPAGYSSLARFTNANGITGFETFCVEGGTNDVYFTPGVTYTYTTSSQVLGGPQGALPLTVGTAWLYSQFATGQLTGYYGASNRNALAGQLQNAFWTLENESNAAIAGWIQTLLTGQFGASSTIADWTAAAGANNFGVQVMNLWTSSTSNVAAQNQLIYNGRSVPDGGLTILLLGVSFLGLALFKRHFAKQV